MTENTMSIITQMSKVEVIDYLHENGLEVHQKPSDKTYPGSTDAAAVGLHIFGFSSDTGFSTFDVPMSSDQARYAAVMFHRLVEEHGLDFSQAEKLAQAYVATYCVMTPPMSEAEQNTVRENLKAAIDAGNIGFCGE